LGRSLTCRDSACQSLCFCSNFYQLGTELQLIGYEGGWFQVVDPGTSQRGWIYAKYLEAIRGPHQTEAASQPLQRATPVAFEPPASPQPLARAKKQQQNAERVQPPVRREELFASAERAQPPVLLLRPTVRVGASTLVMIDTTQDDK
jgi:hypothetical protein